MSEKFQSQKVENISMQIDEINNNNNQEQQQQQKKLNINTNTNTNTNTNSNLNSQTQIQNNINQHDIEYNKKQESRMMNFFNQDFLDRKIDFKPK
jgi:hypothetical protein